MRVTAGAAVGTGLAFASLFPTARAGHAHSDTYSVWEKGTAGKCTPAPFAGSTGCSSCCSLVSSGYCASNGWHDHHNKDSTGTSWQETRIRHTSCYDKNAWIWARNGDWRCSDGQRRICNSSGCGGWGNTVCPRKL